jgi:glycyl-tRNA synthetase (class II)
MSRKFLLLLLLFAAPGVFAQAPLPTFKPVETVTLSRLDELERENIKLLAVVSQLQKQLAEARAEAVATTVQSRAAAWTERMAKQYPDFDIDPDTLEFKKKPSRSDP